MDNQPPSLQEMSQQANQDGWLCPQCNCRDWRVANSHQYGSVRKRQRVCRNCGHDLPTIEINVPEGYVLRIVPENQ